MTTLAALTTTTKSPVSTCGANCGLCLPRSRIATWLASRPSTTSDASITCHWRVTSAGLGLYVRTGLPSLLGAGRRTRDVQRAPAIEGTCGPRDGSKSPPPGDALTGTPRPCPHILRPALIL